jgi:DNA (cytosine-5)-methyltransferase 1
MLKYIDLFAGIGGFHEALKRIGDTSCVFASEIDINASNVYELNHGVSPKGDITKILVEDIPSFDLLCAGFPCQPFSKGGFQSGFDDVRGTLFFDIIRILDFHRPQYVLLENVANLVSHDHGHTYSTIINSLKKLGYVVPDNPIIISPHNLGIPVNRPRVFIPCTLGSSDYEQLNFEVPKINYSSSYISEYFDFKVNNDPELQLSKYEMDVLLMWDEFYKSTDLEVIGFPIWFDYFRLNRIDKSFPKWKLNFIQKNIDFYNRNKVAIDNWMIKYDKLKWVIPSHRKFEWQCGVDCNSVFDGLIQFRPSGVRVKRLNYFSTLVAMNHPQILGPLKRRLSTNETKLLQSFGDDFQLHPSRSIALKQLGNSVNVEVVKFVLNKLIRF